MRDDDAGFSFTLHTRHGSRKSHVSVCPFVTSVCLGLTFSVWLGNISQIRQSGYLQAAQLNLQIRNVINVVLSIQTTTTTIGSILRILLKQNTALLSHVCECVC